MGSACCCLRNDFEDFSHPNSSAYRNCICIPFFLENFLHLYASLFHRGEVHALPSSNPGTASLDSTASQDDYLANSYRSPPPPLPYDADPRFFTLQRDGLVSRRDRGSSHSHEETELFRTSKADDESESVSTKSKGVMFACEDAAKGYSAKSSLKFAKADATAGYAHIYASSEDEDVCPTCLEEYTTENPKIVTKCSHHFHLGCIYEWMERSDKCPVCGKVMNFDETT